MPRSCSLLGEGAGEADERQGHPYGGATAASAETLAELAATIVAGEVVVPIQNTYPLADVRAAFTELEAGHVRGKDRPCPVMIPGVTRSWSRHRRHHQPGRHAATVRT